LSREAQVQHHENGSVTLSPDEAQDLKQLFAAILAGNRIESGFTTASRERELNFRRLYTALTSGDLLTEVDPLIVSPSGPLGDSP
jgi:hypothetical protein